MSANLACDKFWSNKNLYHDAEKKYQENLAKLQRRLGILGDKNEESNTNNNTKTEKNFIKTLSDVNIGELKHKFINFEAQEFSKNKAAHSIEIINKEECLYAKTDNIIFAEKYKHCKEEQKEIKKKTNKKEKKPKKVNKNEDDILGGVGLAKINQDAFLKTSVAGDVAKTQQHLKSSLECMENMNGMGNLTNPRLAAILEKMEKAIENLTKRVEVLEKDCASCKRPENPLIAVCPAKPQPAPTKPPASKDEDDDVDLFGSDSEEEDEETKKVREQRLAEYAAKKSKKPALVAKSNIILDIKPWDDETDMKEMEKAVRAIEMDGLVWGASKLVPVAFKIFKLQISCVIEDDKVSVDLLTETLEGIEDYIQSVDIAAFNKV